MLQISDTTMTAIAAEKRARLRPDILAHWFEDFQQAGDQVGEAGRQHILDEVEAAARADPTLDAADLTMIADLMLVDLASPPASTH